MTDRSQRAARAAGLTFLCVLFAACGGGGNDTIQPSEGSPPVISGRPRAYVLQGQIYSFVPSATATNGNTLTFSASGLPAWATFDTTNGRIRGTPTPADVGTYYNIVVSVSDGSARASLPAFSITVVAFATGSATISWLTPTENYDGSPLMNLAGFRVYWGAEGDTYTNTLTFTNPGLTAVVVDNLTPDTWLFAVTAINEHGVESSFSNVTVKTVL